MKRTLLAASLALVASGLLFAQEPADLAKSPAVQETQEVENDLIEFPVEALTKSMNNSLAKKGLVLGGINNDGSIYIDLPRITLGDGSKDFAVNEKVKLSLTGTSFVDDEYDYSVGITYFPYLPTVKSATC